MAAWRRMSRGCRRGLGRGPIPSRRVSGPCRPRRPARHHRSRRATRPLLLHPCRGRHRGTRALSAVLSDSIEPVKRSSPRPEERAERLDLAVVPRPEIDELFQRILDELLEDTANGSALARWVELGHRPAGDSTNRRDVRVQGLEGRGHGPTPSNEFCKRPPAERVLLVIGVPSGRERGRTRPARRRGCPRRRRWLASPPRRCTRAPSSDRPCRRRGRSGRRWRAAPRRRPRK